MASEKVYFENVRKQLRKVPRGIFEKLMTWAKSVEEKGIRETRKIPGYHDEPLLGNRQGQRSIRLSRSYRAIYSEEDNGFINLVILEEVNKHEY